MEWVSATRPVIIVGGGIAGIACALYLAERAVPVLLLETRTKLGGRATSFKDVRSGETIDNCQHVTMGCCTTYRDLCRRLGVADRIAWHRRINWVEAGGRLSVMEPGSLPAPSHFSWSFAKVRFLDACEKIALAAGLVNLLRQDRSLSTEITFAEWLKRNDQPASIVRKFWEPVIISACNLAPERVCAATAMHVFQEGFLAHRDAAMMGVSAVPLVDLYDAAQPEIERAGGKVMLSTGVERIEPRRVLTTSGEWLDASQVVCAVPPERAHRIVDERTQAIDPRFAMMRSITHSPILGVHLIFDRPVMTLPHAVLVERPTQWLFRKDDASGGGCKLHAVISGADEWLALDEAEVTRRVLADIRACFPATASAALLASRPVKEKLATFAPTPEVEACRPQTVGPGGIVLAGDYVQTGWPATMEGAARSGAMAAAAVLGEPIDALLSPPLPAAPLARLLCAGELAASIPAVENEST